MRLKRKIAVVLAVIMALGSVGIMNLEARTYPIGTNPQGVQGEWVGHSNNHRLTDWFSSPQITGPTRASGVDFVVTGSQLEHGTGNQKQLRLRIGGDGIWNYGAFGINPNAGRATQTVAPNTAHHASTITTGPGNAGANSGVDGNANLLSPIPRVGPGQTWGFERNLPPAPPQITAYTMARELLNLPIHAGLLAMVNVGALDIAWAGQTNRIYLVDAQSRAATHVAYWIQGGGTTGHFDGFHPLAHTNFAKRPGGMGFHNLPPAFNSMVPTTGHYGLWALQVTNEINQRTAPASVAGITDATPDRLVLLPLAPDATLGYHLARVLLLPIDQNLNNMIEIGVYDTGGGWLNPPDKWVNVTPGTVTGDFAGEWEVMEANLSAFWPEFMGVITPPDPARWSVANAIASVGAGITDTGLSVARIHWSDLGAVNPLVGANAAQGSLAVVGTDGGGHVTEIRRHSGLEADWEPIASFSAAPNDDFPWAGFPGNVTFPAPGPAVRGVSPFTNPTAAGWVRLRTEVPTGNVGLVEPIREFVDTNVARLHLQYDMGAHATTIHNIDFLVPGAQRPPLPPLTGGVVAWIPVQLRASSSLNDWGLVGLMVGPGTNTAQMGEASRGGLAGAHPDPGMTAGLANVPPAFLGTVLAGSIHVGAEGTVAPGIPNTAWQYNVARFYRGVTSEPGITTTLISGTAIDWAYPDAPGAPEPARPAQIGINPNIPVAGVGAGGASWIQLTDSIGNMGAQSGTNRMTSIRHTGVNNIAHTAGAQIRNEIPFTLHFEHTNEMVIRWYRADVLAAGGGAQAVLRVPLAVQATGTGAITLEVLAQGSTLTPALVGGANQYITGRPISVVVSTIGNVTTVQAGSNLHFAASVLPNWNNPQFTWSLQTAHPGVTINPNTGLLTVGANVPEGTQITVRAVINNFNHIFGERTVTVVRPAPPSGGVTFTYPNFSSHSSNPNATVNFNVHAHLTPAGAASGFTTLRYEWLREGNVWQGSGGIGMRTADQIGNPIQLQLPGGTHAQRGGNWALRVTLLDANGNVLFVDNSIVIVLTITQPPGQGQESNQDQGSGGNEPSQTPAPTPTSTPTPTPTPASVATATPTPEPVSTPAPDSWVVSEPEATPMPWTPRLAPPAVTPVFNDIDQNSWYANYVTVVTSAGLFQGVAEGQFDAESEMTRAMFAQVLANLNGVDLLVFEGMTASFGDVSSGAWYFGAVQWASSLGIVTGTGDGNFDPNTPISREQMAVMLFRFIQIMGIEIPLDALTMFVDSYAISPWAAEAVATIQAMGIISGRPDGSFDPHTTATRGEVAAIFARLLELVQ